MMIRSVQNFTSKKDPFAVFDRQQYHITPEISKEIFDNNEKSKSKKGRKIGIIVASSSVAAALVALFFTKGVPKNIYKLFDKFGKKLGEKAKNRRLKGNDGKMTRFFGKMHEKMSGFSERAGSINNITSFKDILFMKLMNKTKFTKKIHTGITKLFEKLAYRTVNRNYSHAAKKIGGLSDVFAKANSKIDIEKMIDINGTTKSAGDWLSDIALKQQKMKNNFASGFAETVRNKRYSNLKTITNDLEEKVWAAGVGDLQSASRSEIFQRLKDSKLHNEFIAAKILEPDKAKVLDDVNKLYEAVINENKQILDIYKALLPKKDYNKLLRKSNGAFKKLQGAMNTENNKFFDKYRDMKLGSSPTDVLTIVSATGAVGVALAAADNKDERISALLKYGIPVIGGVTTTLLLTVSLVSGFASLAAGLISSKLINIIGSKVDLARKHHNKQKLDEQYAEAVKSQNA